MKVLELFAGIGACSSALDRLEIEHEIVDAVEIDKYAIQSFNAIHGTSFGVQDICAWDKDLKDIDLIMHGSPCQDFSIAGLQAGGDIGSGTRSSLMYETIRIVGKIRPKYVIWENVKNILSAKHRHNFDNYLNALESLGYTNYYQVLNAKDYGIPQNRERVFTISIRKDIDTKDFVFPEKQELKLRLKDLLEENVDEKYYLSDKMVSFFKKNEEIQKEKGNGFRFNVTDGDVVAKAVTTRAGGRMDDNFVIGKIPQWRERGIVYSCDNTIGTICSTDYKTPKLVGGFGDKNFGNQYRQGNRVYDSNEIAMALTASAVGNLGGNSYLYQIGLRIRKLTPKECWRLMGFTDEEFDKAQCVGISNTQLYKQARKLYRGKCAS